MKIRHTNKKDLEQLPWLLKQNWGGVETLEIKYEDILKEYEELNNSEDYKFISALIKDKLVGFCMAVVNHDIAGKQRSNIMIWRLRVDPKYRRQNIGKSIVSFVENIGRKINASSIVLVCDKKNTGARKFYKKLGYIADCGFTKWL